MKSMFLLCFVAISNLASASFELILVADSAQDAVHRFDGISGTYFGQVGYGSFASLVDIAIDQSANTMYALEDGGITLSAWNYNTGEYYWTRSLGATFRDIGTAPGGGFYLVASGLVRQVDSTFATVQTWTPSAGYEFVSAISQNGATHVGENQIAGTEFRHRLANNDGTLGGYAWGGGAGHGTDSTSTLTSDGQYIGMAYDSQFVLVFNAQGNGQFRTGVVQNTKAVAHGHGAMMYFAGKSVANPAQGVVTRYDAQSFSNRGKFGLGILSDPTSIAVVVAPEPGTLAALGIGAIVLLRRRMPR